MSRPLAVLFVCTANTCRSAAMELLADHLAGGRLSVSSAGTHGDVGHPLEDPMVTPLLARGVSDQRLRDFRSRPLTPALVDAADVVLTAEAAHRRLVVDQRPEATAKVFTLGQLARAVEVSRGSTVHALLRTVGAPDAVADPTDDVADPFRLGSSAAHACAERIEAMLCAVVPVLTRSGRINA